MTMRRREALKGILFILPFLAGFVVFYLWPFLTGMKQTFLFSGKFVGLQHYREVWSSEAFRLVLGNTLRFIAVGAPLGMVVSLALALGLQRKFTGSSFLRSVFLLPQVLPIASIVMVCQVFLDEHGVFNGLLLAMGLPLVQWLTSDAAFFVLILLYIWKNCGYGMILFLAGLNAIPDVLGQAARLDGANHRQVFVHISLPLLMPSIFLTAVFSIMNAFRCFREAYLLCGERPHRSIYMLQHFMNNNFQNLNYPRLFIAATFTFCIIFFLVLALFRVRRKAGDLEL